MTRPGRLMSQLSGLDRASVALGVASIASSLFSFTHGKNQLIWMPAPAVTVALVLGALACLGGLVRSRPLTLAVGAGFLVAAVVLLVRLIGGGVLIGNGAAFSLWLGLGVGLVVLGATPRAA